MAQKWGPAPFLTKTYDLVDDAATNDVVSWSEDGTAFVVWKTAEFAKDLLPNYFKHDNFSSFVRQLNTYGFRKTVSDKWEFANDNFKRGQKQLLAQIRRRRTAAAQIPVSTKPKFPKNSTSPANSGEYLSSSSSTSAPNYKNPNSYQSTHRTDLSIENENLRKENQYLRSELAQTRVHCDQLITFLNHKIDRIMNFGGDNGESYANSESDGEENENCMKLFGVVLKKKRGRDENNDFVGPNRKEMKRDNPWTGILASQEESSEVCN